MITEEILYRRRWPVSREQYDDEQTNGSEVDGDSSGALRNSFAEGSAATRTMSSAKQTAVPSCSGCLSVSHSVFLRMKSYSFFARLAITSIATQLDGQTRLSYGDATPSTANVRSLFPCRPLCNVLHLAFCRRVNINSEQNTGMVSVVLDDEHRKTGCLCNAWSAFVKTIVR